MKVRGVSPRKARVLAVSAVQANASTVGRALLAAASEKAARASVSAAPDVAVVDVAYVVARSTGTQVYGVGMGVPVADGTQSVLSAGARRFVVFTSGNQSGDAAGLNGTGTPIVSTDVDWTATIVVRTLASLSGHRLWMGFFETSPTNSGSPPNNTIAFRITGGTDTKPQGICRDGSGNTAAGAPDVAVATATTFYLRIRHKAGTGVYFSARAGDTGDYSAEQAVTTYRPAAGVQLGWAVRTLNNGGGAPTALGFNSISIRWEA